MKIQVFNGGLSTRQLPQYLGTSEAAELHNTDISAGCLKPLKEVKPTSFSGTGYPFYYERTDTWYYSAVKRNYVEFLRKLYWSDGSGIPQVEGKNLGIAAPVAAPTLALGGNLETPVSARIYAEVPSVGPGGDLPATPLKYRLLNTDGTYYSGAYDITLNAANNRYDIDEIDKYYGRTKLTVEKSAVVTDTFNRVVYFTGFSGFTFGSGGVEIYREYKGKWYLVDTMTVPDIGSATDATYNISANAELDENKIAPLSGTYSYCYTYYNSTDGIESAPSPVSEELVDVLGYITVSNIVASTDTQVDKIRLYRIGGDKTAFSLVLELPNSSTPYVDNNPDTEIDGRVLVSQTYGQAPTGLKYLTEMHAIMFGAIDSKLYFSLKGKPYAWYELNYLEFGVDITGIAKTTGGLLVFSKYRTFIVVGTSIADFAQYTLDNTQGCLDYRSIQNIGGACLFLSTDGLCLSDGNMVKVISKDKLGKFKWDALDSIVHDEVYYVSDASLKVLCYDFRYGTGTFRTFGNGVKYFVVSNDVLYGSTGQTVYELFASQYFLSMKYKSPRFVEGTITEDKTYKKFHFFINGVIIIDIIINDVTVVTGHRLEGKGHFTIQVPSDKQRGNYVQFYVTGTGELYEIEYEVGRGHGH